MTKNNNLKTVVDQQHEEIEKLKSTVDILLTKVARLEGHIIVSQHVSEILHRQMDDLEAYSCRSCLVIAGMQKNEDEKQNDLKNETVKLSEETAKIPGNQILKNIDKLHRVGKYNHNDKTQSVIVKFTSHSFKEKVFSKRSNLKKNIKLKPSVTKWHSELIAEANEHIKNFSKKCEKAFPEDFKVKFAFADVTGTPKVSVERKDSPEYYAFNSMDEFLDILVKLETHVSKEET